MEPMTVKASCPKDGWSDIYHLSHADVLLAILKGKCQRCAGPVVVEQVQPVERS